MGAAWLEGHGLSMGPEVLGRSSRVRRAALSLPMQPEEPVVARYDATKTATMTILPSCRCAASPQA